jgi:hypothetical protein
MNSNNQLLFLCLCKDLGYSPVIYPTEHQLNDLKKRLLQLAESRFDDSLYSQFRADLYSLFKRDFSRSGSFGPVLPDLQDPVEFRNVYQLLSFQLKIKKLHTHEQENEYVRRFKSTEETTRAWRINRSNPISRLAQYITRYSCFGLDLSADAISTGARHGPGAVSDGSYFDDKSWWTCHYRPLLSVFPEDWFFANPSLLSECLRDRSYPIHDRIQARLALVPKDWKGPRGVYISPKEAVFCQLGIDAALKRFMRTSWFRFCYDDKSQFPSQEAAHMGSYDPSFWSTLDLSDASDRIPLSLISYLFHRKDYLAIACTRPSEVILPSGEKLRIAMSSPMGDGKTFAVLTMVCAIVSLAAILHAEGYFAARPPSRSVIECYAKKLRVFGDDIAVHSKYFTAVCEALEIHNLKVNVDKSFSRGFFRESCGLDAYKGIDVTPLRQRCDLDGKIDIGELIAFHNRIYTSYSHLGSVLAFVRSVIMDATRRTVTFTSNCERSPLALMAPACDVVRQNLLAGRRIKFCTDTHRLLVYGYRGVSDLIYPEPIDDRYRLNYRLFPRQADYNPYSKGRRGRGSPWFAKTVENHLLRAGVPACRIPRIQFLRGWIEM